MGGGSTFSRMSVCRVFNLSDSLPQTNSVRALLLHVFQQGESFRLLLRLVSLHLRHIQDLDIHCNDKQTDSKIKGTLKRSLAWRRLMPSSL